MRRGRRISLVVLGLVLAACAARRPGSPIRPGINLFSKEQDVQIGREAAQQVRQQYPVVRDQDLQSFIQQLGRRLTSSPQAGDYPYEFTLLNQKEVNAFALPGGPVFVFSGLFTEADNEAQVAGVLAHEIAHVALRHGTNQASKASLLQIPAAIAGAAAGQSTLGQVVQLGLGAGLNGLFLKYSRTAESQADALGARIMADAGFNPIEMARFFEKLEAKGGPGVPQFLSDHPTPGNRIQAVEAEIRTFPQKEYAADGVGDFNRIKSEVAQLPAPPARQQRAAAGAPADGSGFRELQSSRFTLAYPAAWEALGDQTSTSVTLAPREALVEGAGGNLEIGYGAIAGFFSPSSGGSLQQGTRELIDRLRSTNPSMAVRSNQRRVTVDGSQGLVTNLASESPYGGQAERDVLLTVQRPDGLFYLVFIAPERNFGQLQSAFQRMLESLKFRG